MTIVVVGLFSILIVGTSLTPFLTLTLRGYLLTPVTSPFPPISFSLILTFPVFLSSTSIFHLLDLQPHELYSTGNHEWEPRVPLSLYLSFTPSASIRLNAPKACADSARHNLFDSQSTCTWKGAASDHSNVRNQQHAGFKGRPWHALQFNVMMPHWISAFAIITMHRMLFNFRIPS